MMSLYFITLMINLSWANSEVNSFLSSLAKIENQITRSSLQSCKMSNGQNQCRLDEVCKTLAERFDNKYLYENSIGEKLENFQLSWAREAAIRCVGNFDKDLDYGPFYSISGVNVMFDPDNSEYQKERTKKEKRLEKIFIQAKNQSIEFLKSRAQKDKKFQVGLENLIKRVEAVRLDIFRFSKNGFRGDCDLPNAFYSPLKTSVEICPQLLDLPEGALLAVMTHELGHAIDPCQASLNYFQYPSGNFKLTRQDDIEEIGDGGNSSLTLAIPKIDSQDYPFKDTLSCLQRPEAAGLERPSQKKQLQSIQDSLADSALEEEDRQHLMQKRNAITQAFQENPYCRDYTDSRHSEEIFADWFSAQVMAQIVSETASSARKKDLSYESLIFVVADSCPDLKEKTKNLFLTGTQGDVLKKCSLFNPEVPIYGEEGVVHPHPPIQQRFERIVLAQPTLRKALQCPGSQQVLACP